MASPEGTAWLSFSFSLAISVPLSITSVQLAGQTPVLRFVAFAGREYWVQYSPTLDPADWSTLPGGKLLGDGHEVAVTDFLSLAPGAMRFYRVGEVPVVK